MSETYGYGGMFARAARRERLSEYLAEYTPDLVEPCPSCLGNGCIRCGHTGTFLTPLLYVLDKPQTMD